MSSPRNQGFQPKYFIPKAEKKQYYKITERGNRPSAKLSVIVEYCWLLEKVDTERKFLIFGQNRRVPLIFLNSFGSLVKEIEFYFFDGEKLEKLN